MYKVMIADDEYHFREYLKEVIDWKKYGFELCIEARNGVEALEQTDGTVPDIALVDINMPYMDGLALAEKLKEKYQDIFIIIITGYNEFEYAKKAIQIGVVDYLLKPFTREELLTILDKIKIIIRSRKNKENFTEQNKNYMKEKLLNLLISDECNIPEEEILREFNSYGIEFDSTNFFVATIELDDMYQKWNDANDIILWKNSVTNIIEELTEGKHLIFKGPQGRIVSIVETGSKTDNSSKLVSYKSLCGIIRKYFDFTVTVGVGKERAGFKGIRNSYEESVVAIQNKMILGCSKVIEYSEIDSRYSNLEIYPNKINENLIACLRSNDRAGIEENLNKVFAYISENKPSPDFIRIMLAGLISLCMSYTFEKGKNIEEVFGKDFKPYSEVVEKGSLDETHKFIYEMYTAVLTKTTVNRLTKSRKLFNTVSDYIKLHYNDRDLSIEKISREVFVTSGYLRKVFQKEAGMSVNDYILSIRMKKAKELIVSKSVKLSDIAEMVGYQYPSYFSRLFKHVFGVSPSEYENQIK